MLFNPQSNTGQLHCVVLLNDSTDNNRFHVKLRHLPLSHIRIPHVLSQPGYYSSIRPDPGFSLPWPSLAFLSPDFHWRFAR